MLVSYKDEEAGFVQKAAVLAEHAGFVRKRGGVLGEHAGVLQYKTRWVPVEHAKEGAS